MRLYLTALFYLLCNILAFAQNLPNQNEPENVPNFGCNSASITQLRAKYSAHFDSVEAQVAALRQKWQTAAQRGQAETFTLPVVFHIIHNGGPENVPDATIEKALELLNLAFAHEGPYAFIAGTKMPFQFCLARRTPDGKPTNGITRSQSKFTVVQSYADDDSLKNIDRWDPTRYINIWITKRLYWPNVGELAGYSTYPYSHGSSLDGIVMAANFLREIRVLPHEMGHFLGLFHTFEGGCANYNCEQNGDWVCDTPPDMGIYTSCGFSSCNTDSIAPAPNPFTRDMPDHTENFMDYSGCSRVFTPGQGERMALLTKTIRFSLLSSSACYDPCPVPIAAAFATPTGPYETGQTIVFQNKSQHAKAYEWYVNGTLVSSNPNMSYLFEETGPHQIRLLAKGDALGCASDSVVRLDVNCNVQGFIASDRTEVLTGQAIRFRSVLKGASYYRWMLDGAPVGVDSVLTRTFTKEGVYLVALQASSDFCERTFSMSVRVSKFCAPSVPEQWAYTFKPFTPEFISINRCNNGDYVLRESNYCFRLKQDGTPLWAKSFYNNSSLFSISGLKPLSNGDFLGISTSPIFLLDSLGNVRWVKKITSKNSFGNIVDATPDGHLFRLSYTYRSTRLTKIDTTGNVLWALEKLDTLIQSYLVTSRLDGGCFWLLTRKNVPYNTYVLLSISPVGHVEWAKEIGNQRFPLHAILPDQDGGVSIFLAEYFFPPYTRLLLKYDAKGELLFTKRILFKDLQNGGTYASFAHKTADDGYLISSVAQSFDLETNQGVARLDKQGNLVFARQFKFQSNTNSSSIDLVNGGWGDIDQTLLLINLKEYPETFHLMRTNNAGDGGGCYDSPTSVNISIVQDVLTKPSNFTLLPVQDTIDVVFDTLTSVTHTITREPICTQYPTCSENCGNGFDDDRDGYTDCFDPDCKCSANVSCKQESASGPWEAAVYWQSQSDSVFSAFTPVVANLDPWRDSIPEMVVALKQAPFPNPISVILNGDGSNTASSFRVAQGSAPNKFYGILVADVNRDDKPDLLIQPNHEMRVSVFTNYDNNTGKFNTLNSTTVFPIPRPKGAYNRPQVADLDSDGAVEYLSGNAIFTRYDAKQVTLKIPPDTTRPHGRLAFQRHKLSLASPVVADLLNKGQCSGNTDCDGLEIAAGPVIYGVDITPYDGDAQGLSIQRNLNTMAPAYTWHDGYTALADLNLDGTPEVIVASRRNEEHGVYVWNASGLVRFFPYPSNTPFSGGMPCVANVFDDRKNGFAVDWPEIIAASANRVTCFNLNAATQNPAAPWWWSVETRDSMGILSPTAFDFDADGTDEVVFRDELHLRILYGGAAPFPTGVGPDRNLLRFDAPGLPMDSQPVVADCDGDGAAEIITVRGQSPKSTFGTLTVLRSARQPWANARPHWGQFGVYPTQTAENLAVPITPTAPWRTFGNNQRPFNRFNAQTPRYDAQFKPTVNWPDVALHIEDTWCAEEHILAQVRICNKGKGRMSAEMPIRLYTGAPAQTAAQPWGTTHYLGASLAPGQCQTDTLRVPATQARLYAVAGDDGSKQTPWGTVAPIVFNSHPDCFFANNTATLQYQWDSPTLTLGPDITTCSGNAVPLDAGPGFTLYQWQNNQNTRTITAPAPGTYWVEVLDACGYRQRDTIQIILDTTATLELGMDRQLCLGDTLLLQPTGAERFEQVSWSSDKALLCAHCLALRWAPKESTTLSVSAFSGDCIASDTLHVSVAAIFAQTTVRDAHEGIPDGRVEVSVSGNYGPFTYLWDTQPPQTTPSIDSIAAGDYTVTVTDAVGCSTVAKARVNALVNTSETGPLPRFSIAPNPSADRFWVNIEHLPYPEASLEVWDLLGQRLHHQFLPKAAAKVEINCAAWPAGAYRVVLRLGNGQQGGAVMVKTNK